MSSKGVCVSGCICQGWFLKLIQSLYLVPCEKLLLEFFSVPLWAAVVKSSCNASVCVCLHHTFFFVCASVQTACSDCVPWTATRPRSSSGKRRSLEGTPTLCSSTSCMWAKWWHVHVRAVTADPFALVNVCWRRLTDQRATAPTAENPSCWGRACFTFLPSTLFLLSSCSI